MRMLLVGGAQDLAFVRPGGTQQSFEVKTGYHVLHFPVAIVAPYLRVECLIARRQNDRPYSDFYLLRLLMKMYGFILAYSFANGTFLLFEVKAAFIDVRDQGNGLSEIDMDGLILRYLLIKSIRVFDRTVFYTGRTTCAFVLQNIPGLPNQRYLEVSCFPLYTINFSVGQDLYIGIPADLDQFGREYSDGAVIGGKGFVKLGHMAANGRRLFDQVNLKTRSGKIKRRLNAADPSTDNHHISKMTACETFANTVCETFTNLVFNFFEFFIHLLSPHQV